MTTVELFYRGATFAGVVGTHFFGFVTVNLVLALISSAIALAAILLDAHHKKMMRRISQDRLDREFPLDKKEDNEET